MAVVSSCCEMLLSPATSATLILVASGPAGNSKETASDKLEEGGMTSSHHGPYDQGYTCYNGAYKEKRPRESKRTS